MIVPPPAVSPGKSSRFALPLVAVRGAALHTRYVTPDDEAYAVEYVPPHARTRTHTHGLGFLEGPRKKEKKDDAAVCVSAAGLKMHN